MLHKLLYQPKAHDANVSAARATAIEEYESAVKNRFLGARSFFIKQTGANLQDGSDAWATMSVAETLPYKNMAKACRMSAKQYLRTHDDPRRVAGTDQQELEFDNPLPYMSAELPLKPELLSPPMQWQGLNTWHQENN